MNKLKIVVASLAIALSGFSAASDKVSADTAPEFPAWDNFVNDLRDLWPAMYSKLPEELRHDPQIQQEVGRLMLQAIAARTIDAVSADGDHPWFLPHLGLTMNVFQPNADTVYRNAQITPGGTYRLRGKLGSVRIFKMAQFGPTPPDTGKGVRAFSYNDFSTLSVDENGQFDVVLSITKPENHSGDWWPLNPATTHLMVRQVSSDWAKEQDPTLAIERLDIPVNAPRTDAKTLEFRLEQLSRRINNSASFFVNHVGQLQEEGYVNKLKVFDVVSNLAGLFGQFYYEGAYQLTEDEALIISAKVPEQCQYYSMILTNQLYETTDWYNNQSSLNDSQLHVDSDGILRIVISAKDPGVANWLDTAGYNKGAVQGRWTDCTAQPIPSVLKVNINDVQKSLPQDTKLVSLKQREAIIRSRRAAFQQRPLW